MADPTATAAADLAALLAPAGLAPDPPGPLDLTQLDQLKRRCWQSEGIAFSAALTEAFARSFAAVVADRWISRWSDGPDGPVLQVKAGEQALGVDVLAVGRLAFTTSGESFAEAAAGLTASLDANGAERIA